MLEDLLWPKTRDNNKQGKLHNEGHNLWSVLNIRIEGTLAENLKDTLQRQGINKRNNTCFVCSQKFVHRDSRVSSCIAMVQRSITQIPFCSLFLPQIFVCNYKNVKKAIIHSVQWSWLVLPLWVWRWWASPHRKLLHGFWFVPINARFIIVIIFKRNCASFSSPRWRFCNVLHHSPSVPHLAGRVWIWWLSWYMLRSCFKMLWTDTDEIHNMLSTLWIVIFLCWRTSSFTQSTLFNLESLSRISVFHIVCSPKAARNISEVCGTFFQI